LFPALPYVLIVGQWSIQRAVVNRCTSHMKVVWLISEVAHESTRWTWIVVPARNIDSISVFRKEIINKHTTGRPRAWDISTPQLFDKYAMN